MMGVIPFRSRRSASGGTIHIWGDRQDGFTVSHESSSGSSWGELHGPFGSAQSAITFACVLNRDTYDGDCEISACDEALADAHAGSGPARTPGEF